MKTAPVCGAGPAHPRLSAPRAQRTEKRRLSTSDLDLDRSIPRSSAVEGRFQRLPKRSLATNPEVIVTARKLDAVALLGVAAC